MGQMPANSYQPSSSYHQHGPILQRQNIRKSGPVIFNFDL